MSKQRNNFPDKPSLKPLTNSLMAHPQLIDSLTSHISLYHSHSLPPSSNPNPRSFILKWFSSLTVHQRQAHLTIVDSKFVQILIQMVGKIRTHGHGFFIILSDLPSLDPPYLPSLCHKKSFGLLSRVAESNELERWILDSSRLFGSREGEKIEECLCSVKNLDTMTVAEDFVENVDRFVEAMDEVSNGSFLRGEESELGADWLELQWLKSKGYYSIQAFVANRLEVAMRLAWLNSNSGKKRGVKLKEKLNGAGVSANVYWRKKGCVDWCGNLDSSMRKKVLTTILGKGAKSLTREILEGASSASEDELWLFNTGVAQSLKYNFTESARTIRRFADDIELGTIVNRVSPSRNPPSLTSIFNCLVVLLDIITMILSCQNSEYDIGKLFFSTLASVSTVSDCIARKLRGLLMVISLDCTKHELLGEENKKSLPSKSKEKSGTCSRKKKGRSRSVKRPIPVPKSRVDDISREKSVKDLDIELADKEESDLMESRQIYDVPLRKDICGSSSSFEMEHNQGSGVAKLRTTSRRSKKEKNKNRNSTVKSKVGDSQRSAMDAFSTSIISECEVAISDKVSDNSTIQHVKNGNSNGNDITASKSSLSSSCKGSTREDNSTPRIQGFRTEVSRGSCNNSGPECYLFSNANKSSSSGLDRSNSSLDCNIVTPPVPVLEVGSVFSNEDTNLYSLRISESDTKSVFLEKSIRPVEVKEEPLLFKEQYNRNIYDVRTSTFSKSSPYEWPSFASIYIPSVNPHLPAATDRLHLDVGHNWHNHFCHSFLPTLQQARNSPVEGGCNKILSRPLPVSLDWPPVVRGGIAPSLTCNYDSGFLSRRQSTLSKGLAPQYMQLSAKTFDEERRYSGDLADVPDLTNAQELVDECDSHWISEEEFEVHPVSGIDYNQYFGGGIMYWDPSDHPGTGFSRPPSLSSDDSIWAWPEADMNRAVDDMVAFSSSYSTNGLTSPTAASFCSPFDPLGPGHQALGYVVSSNEVTGMHSSPPVTDSAAEEDTSRSVANNLTGDIETKTVEPHPYPILRPIIIPSLSRERSRSEFKPSHDHKSPCLPLTRREQPRIKRPPSPVVLCVPRAPRPPPPSPVSDSRKQRGFSTVRSGSSSPRHWGMRGWYHDGNNLEEACLRKDGAEVVWPSWRSKSLAARPIIQPLPAALLQDRLIAISQLARDQEHPDVTIPLQPPELQSCPTRSESLCLMHSLLHDEIDSFCKQVAAENMARKPYINWAVKRVTRSLQVLWPRSRTNIFGSTATGLSLPTSDVDLVVCLPPVRNLEPIKEAGILEGRNGIKETCLQHAARYLANQDWVKNDSLKTVENTAIPIIMLMVEVPHDIIISCASNVQSPKEESTCTTGEHGNDVHSDVVGLEDSALPKCSQINSDNTKDSRTVRVDISFKSPSHTGLQTTELVKELTEQFPAATPLAFALKQFLADRSLDHSYSGGLSSYCLVLLIIRFLQHEHHLGRPNNQNFGSLLMDFLYFFGNVFDPRQMRVSVQGSGVYVNRERGCSIDPVHIDDPLFPSNNVGRNCFRIHQCIKAFAEAYSILEHELQFLNGDGESCSRPPYRLLPKIIPNIDLL
ncbi:Non-canonical poly(A) RNA polymerase [Quillaja saponaria]|uniref:Non-canonical poly(A) RNA polymerase n=1 Tax=Quillaja saponaria TaxID=32244 RepID=A0AAD7LQ94_QUISA|nr:Non-canonical poly(A) RNA polymerase [Quillaja saponaria]KAJ7962103.1 Non-canonical poly(A) RNA polymerase [Quillaja saponaria]